MSAPRLFPDVTRREATDGVQLARAGSFMNLDAREARILPLMDGRPLDELVRAALPEGLRPMQVLGCLRRLHGAGMLDGVDAEKVFGRSRGGLLERLLGALGDRHLLVPGLAAPLELGRAIPPGWWPGLHLAGGLLMAATLLLGATYGGFRQLTDPLPVTPAPLTLLLLLYGMAGVALTLRAGGIGLAMRSHGVAVGGAGLRLTFGILHLEVDQRHRGSAPREARLQIALAGLSSLAWVFALAGLAYIFTSSGWARLLAVASLLALLANLSPYGRSDAWHVAGILTRIPSLRRRAFSFLLRQVGRNLRRNRATGPEERRYLLLVSAWVVHAVVVVVLLVERLVPGALGLFASTISGNEVEYYLVSVLATGALALMVLAVSLAYLLALFGLVVAFAVSVGRAGEQRGRAADVRPGDVEAFLSAADSVPFLARLGEASRRRIAGALRREVYGEGAAVLVQGEPGDRFCFLREGECRVEAEEAAGIVHDVAHLSTGSFFGEVALLEDRPRNATVRAAGDVSVLTLDRPTFEALVAELDVPWEQLVADLRVAALLRRVPALTELSPPELDRLQRALVWEQHPDGAALVSEGDAGDAMYLVQAGRCRVDRGGETIAELGPGDHFGEIALLTDGARTASVHAEGEVTVLRLPAPAFREVLMANFDAALLLDQGCADRLDALAVAR